MFLVWNWDSTLYYIRIITLSFIWNVCEWIYKNLHSPTPRDKTIKHVPKTCIIDIDVGLFIHSCWKHYLFCRSTQEPYLSSHCIGIHKKCCSPYLQQKMISTLVSFDRQNVSFLCIEEAWETIWKNVWELYEHGH